MEKAKLVEILKREFSLPVKEMSKFPVLKFSDLLSLLPDTDLSRLPSNEKYIEMISSGFILGYKELRNYNGEDYGYHWGIDVLHSEGTPVYAADAGEVLWTMPVTDLTPDFSGATYGNFIILEHRYDSQKVYTLYGHLADITHKLARRQHVLKGEQLGMFGKAFTVENGGWPPHLHFQIGLSIKGLNAYEDLSLEKETLNPLEVFGLC